MKYAREIRPLTYGDFKRLKNMFGTYIGRTGDETIKGLISAARSAEGKKDEGSQDGVVIAAFLEVFKKLAAHLDTEVHAWFCDLINVTPDEYEILPLDMDIQILNQLKESPEVGNFFTGVSLLSSGTAWSEKLLKTLKGKFVTLIESLSENSRE